MVNQGGKFYRHSRELVQTHNQINLFFPIFSDLLYIYTLNVYALNLNVLCEYFIV